MADRELADFDPTTGHLHTCMAEGDPEAGCAQGCAGHNPAARFTLVGDGCRTFAGDGRAG